MASLFTYPRPVQELAAGDVYLTGTVGGAHESREVLEVLTHGPLGFALLQVRDPRGAEFRCHMYGRAQVLEVQA